MTDDRPANFRDQRDDRIGPRSKRIHKVRLVAPTERRRVHIVNQCPIGPLLCSNPHYSDPRFVG